MTAAVQPASATVPTAQAAHGAMLDKARAVTAKVASLSRDFAGAHRLAQQAQVREALTRTELTLALTESSPPGPSSRRACATKRSLPIRPAAAAGRAATTA